MYFFKDLPITLIELICGKVSVALGNGNVAVAGQLLG
jgi:hypothetical protein